MEPCRLRTPEANGPFMPAPTRHGQPSCLRAGRSDWPSRTCTNETPPPVDPLGQRYLTGEMVSTRPSEICLLARERGTPGAAPGPRRRPRRPRTPCYDKLRGRRLPGSPSAAHLIRYVRTLGAVHVTVLSPVSVHLSAYTSSPKWALMTARAGRHAFAGIRRQRPNLVRSVKDLLRSPLSRPSSVAGSRARAGGNGPAHHRKSSDRRALGGQVHAFGSVRKLLTRGRPHDRLT